MGWLLRGALLRNWSYTRVTLPSPLTKNPCVQFTDNGQIIFPKSDYDVFSYPNPPQRGFTGREHVAMVAPFWGDADFSSSKGAIFYQVGHSRSWQSGTPSILPAGIKGTSRALYHNLDFHGKGLKFKYRVQRKPRKDAK